MKSPTATPTALTCKPLKLTGSLADFEKGILCQVIAVRYKGKGPVKLILHEAELIEGTAAYAYGNKHHWTVSPGTLMGAVRSPKKASASRKNGAKGGRPKTAVS